MKKEPHSKAIGTIFAACVAVALLLWGCQRDPNDREPAIQRMIDSWHAKGGGVIQLPAGVHLTGNTLLLRSGVHLVGAGAEATVIRPIVKDLHGKAVGLASVDAVIGMVAVADASIRNLTLDLATEAVVDNGIASRAELALQPQGLL